MYRFYSTGAAAARLLLMMMTTHNVDVVEGLAQPSPPPSRRSFLSGVVASGAALATSNSLLLSPTPAAYALEGADGTATGTEELIDVYFGCGCFWHVQHEFVQAEKNILGRTDDRLTSRAGYAGGRLGALDGKVCYHNAVTASDYGRLGHAEVVNIRIPASKFSEFAVEYCNLFSNEGFRADQFGDRGREYRNLVGLPGGTSSIYAQQLVEASKTAGDKLGFAKGKGSDGDTWALSFIMDTNEFPFFVAEQYHQFHDGFNPGENYPNSYNGLAGKLAKEGTLGESKCPNGLLGVGVLGL